MRKLDFCDSAQARQLKQQLRSALVAGQWRGDTTLTLPSIVLAAVHGLFLAVSTLSPRMRKIICAEKEPVPPQEATPQTG